MYFKQQTFISVDKYQCPVNRERGEQKLLEVDFKKFLLKGKDKRKESYNYHEWQIKKKVKEKKPSSFHSSLFKAQ